jgi:hypothetical protein
MSELQREAAVFFFARKKREAISDNFGGCGEKDDFAANSMEMSAV